MFKKKNIYKLNEVIETLIRSQWQQNEEEKPNNTRMSEHFQTQHDKS